MTNSLKEFVKSLNSIGISRNNWKMISVISRILLIIPTIKIFTTQSFNIDYMHNFKHVLLDIRNKCTIDAASLDGMTGI